jgi:fructose-bisphosphate aldolase class I
MTTTDTLIETARAMVAPGKGILAIDETAPTCTKRFVQSGIESTADSRRAYREMLITAPGLDDYISGAILVDETIRQETSRGEPIPHALRDGGMIPGIKVDGGTRPLGNSAKESVTVGLDGLEDRLQEYRRMGARFTKWRAIFHITDDLPSRQAIEANAEALAEYAALAQATGLVPIVEPEVLMDGSHGIERSGDVTEAVLAAVFERLKARGCRLEGMVLKPNMATSGAQAANKAGPAEVADRTIEILRRCVPEQVPGIAFLSGGQTGDEACANLNAMAARGPLPWALTYSFGRALQYPALEIWGGNAANAGAAQEALLHRARMSSLASSGQYSVEAERSGNRSG